MSQQAAMPPEPSRAGPVAAGDPARGGRLTTQARAVVGEREAAGLPASTGLHALFVLVFAAATCGVLHAAGLGSGLPEVVETTRAIGYTQVEMLQDARSLVSCLLGALLTWGLGQGGLPEVPDQAAAAAAAAAAAQPTKPHLLALLL